MGSAEVPAVAADSPAPGPASLGAGRVRAPGGTAFGGPGGTSRTGGGTGGSTGGGGTGSAGTGTAVPGGTGSAGTRPGGTSGANGVPSGAGGFGGRGGGFGGLGGSTAVSSALVKLLEQNAASYKWVAATEGSEAAAPLELATGDAVMAIGGFNGTDPWPTLAAFEALVAKHEVHYYVGQGSESFGGGQGSSAITRWVAAHFTSETVGGQTVYNLTEPTS